MNLLKNKTMLGTAAAFAVAGGLQQAQALPANALEVTSDVTTDTTWTINDSPVVLRDLIFVREGATLTIEAGVTVVSFQAEGQDGPGGVPNANDFAQNENGGLVVTRGSQIFGLGTKTQPVIFTSADDVATWDGTTGVETTEITFDPDPDPDSTGDEITRTIVTDFDTIGDQNSGQWRFSALEWRNLTICGEAVVSSYEFGDPLADRLDSNGQPNPSFPSGTSGPAEVQMEGLLTSDVPAGSEADVFYGGGNDDDDSGVLNYVSIRYGGRVVGTGNELNGLSLGGVGRGTDISHVEIMNNVDDGIELWGGTVDLDHFIIYNVGDDSLDFDQGWRGSGQFGLIVQGASLAQGQGSGFGDNSIEGDGAENSDGQPRSSITLRNMTVIGTPPGSAKDNSDGVVTYRDNARIQVRRSIFADSGAQTIRLDYIDGDGALGYGYNGTHSWADTWTTTVANDPLSNGGENNANSDLLVDGSTPAQFQYAALYGGAQETSPNGDGRLNEIRDTVVDVRTPLVGYDTSDIAAGAEPLDPQFDTAAKLNTFLTDPGSGFAIAIDAAPLTQIGRSGVDSQGNIEGIDAGYNAGNLEFSLVDDLDPRPTASAGTPADPDLDVVPGTGKFVPFPVRGAFSQSNWADGWSAADSYGLFVDGFDRIEAEEVAVEVVALTSVITFNADPALTYLVEASDDGVQFEAVAQISGKSGNVAIEDELGASFDDTKIYRVSVQ